MSQETKNKNEQPKDEAVSEQVPEKELPAEEPKENAENPQEAKAEEAKKEEKPSELDAVKEQLAKGDVDMVYACGPRPMLKFVAAAAKEYGVRCEVSMEERMGCGIGACLVCACQLEREGKSVMGHVCKDGPVFPAEEVVW